MTRELKDNEIRWMREMERLLKRQPKRISLFADGCLCIVDTKELENFNIIEHFQPIYIFKNGKCGGGDPWS